MEGSSLAMEQSAGTIAFSTFAPRARQALTVH